MATIAIDLRADGPTAVAELARASREALDAPLTTDAHLLVAFPDVPAIVRGALRPPGALGARSGVARERRGSGGADVEVGEGALWVQLRLARSDALVPCEPSRLLNRYVRPLLRALGKVGAPAAYFDRDWISVRGRPAGIVAFGHDASSGRALVEVFVAVSGTLFEASRASFRGKEPLELGSLGVTVEATARAVVAAYADGHESTSSRVAPASGVAVARVDVASAADVREDDVFAAGSGGGDDAEPHAIAAVDEAIGRVEAWRDHAGRLRVGGELMASRDALSTIERAIARLEERSAPSSPDDESDRRAWIEGVTAIVDDAFADPRATLFGVRSLASIRDAIVQVSTERSR